MLVLLGLIAAVGPGATVALGEHLGHLVVLLGMALALVGIVTRGIQIRFTTAKGERSHAIR
jgi:hypothetical protein